MADALETNIDKFKGEIYKSNFDISKHFLPDKEIVKNLIASKGNFTKDDTHMMVDGKMKISKPEDIRGSVDNAKKIKDEQAAKAKGDASSKLKDAKGKQNEAMDSAEEQVSGVAAKVYPLPDNSPLHKEVKEQKEKVRESCAMLMKERDAVSKELINVTLLLANSVPAILGLSVTIPIPNIPSAIALACSIISLVSKLIDKIQDIFQHLEPLKKLKIMIAPEKYKKVTAPLVAALAALTALLKPILALKKAVQALLGQISKLVSPDSIKSQVKSLRKQIKNKGKEIKEAKDDGEDQDTIDNLEKEKRDMQDQLDKLLSGDVAKSADIDKIKNDIDKNLAEAIEADTNVQYVYDVKLPDGTILADQTDEDLAALTDTYNIIYQNG